MYRQIFSTKTTLERGYYLRRFLTTGDVFSVKRRPHPFMFIGNRGAFWSLVHFGGGRWL